jgi:diaminohydroxyphosphoribosylaminopyrimidine deaminase/5-amino-6-(5-phosphoribosylamino)uracil reductase
MDLHVALRKAIAAASGARTHPNPSAGCVILDAGGELVGVGRHEGPGSPHAERRAVAGLGASAQGGTAVRSAPGPHNKGREAAMAAVRAALVQRSLP